MVSVDHLQRGPRKSGDDWVLWTPAAFAWQAQHLEHLRLILRGRRSTWSTSNTTSPTHAIYITSSTQHHQHNLINTSPSTQHPLHNTIYTTSSKQHHLHYIITYWKVQHLEHFHLTPSASFLLTPLLLFFVVASFFVLFLWPIPRMSEDIVNMWGYPVLSLVMSNELKNYRTG